VMDEMFKVMIDGSGKIHHMTGITVADGREHEDFVGNLSSGAARDFGWTNDVYVQRQVRSVLFHRATRHDADFAQFDSIINLRPGQFFVTMFLTRSSSHWYFFDSVSLGCCEI